MKLFMKKRFSLLAQKRLLPAASEWPPKGERKFAFGKSE